jgi:hypothetical protein
MSSINNQSRNNNNRRQLFNSTSFNNNRSRNRSRASSRASSRNNSMHDWYLRKSYGYTKHITKMTLGAGILSDKSQLWWSFLKSDDKARDKIRSAVPEINKQFPNIFKFSNDYNTFRDYIYNYINKPCKIFVDFDKNREGKYFTKLFN